MDIVRKYDEPLQGLDFERHYEFEGMRGLFQLS